MSAHLSIGILASKGLHLDSFFVNIGAQLRARGHQVHFAAGTPMLRDRARVIDSVTGRPSPANLRSGAALRHWVHQIGADVVLVNTATAGVLARRASLPVPVVYFAHGLHWGRAGAVRTAHWELLERACLSDTAAAIVLNDEDQAWFERWAPTLPVHRLPFGVGLPPGQFRPAPPVETNVVVWIGEHTPRKRPRLALEVAAELRGRGTPIRLRMLGQGPLTPTLHERAETLGVADDIEWPGFVPVADELREARLLLHTSLWEGLPRVMLEAMAIHRPTVAFDVKGVRRLPAVHVAPDGDVPTMADLVSHLLTQPVAEDVFPSTDALSDAPVTDTLESILHQSIASAQDASIPRVD